MADISNLHAVAGVEVFFEGEDDEYAVCYAADFFDAFFFPGPDLGGDVVKDFQALFFGPVGDAQVEAGEVYEDEGIGPAAADFRFGEAEVSGDAAQVFGDFPKAHEGHLAVVEQQLASCGLHAVASEEEEFGLCIPCFQGLHEPGGVHVARGFAGDEEVAHGGGFRARF